MADCTLHEEAAVSAESSPLLDSLPGAVSAGGIDAPVAGHYGDPLREQRRLVCSSAAQPVLVDLSHREVLSVSGQDRASWLTTLSSQVFTGQPVGASLEALFLSVQGRIEWAPHAVIGEDRIWLSVEPGQAEALAAFLESMRFMLRVEVSRNPEAAVLGSVVEPSALPGIDAARLAPCWKDPWPGVVPGGYPYASEEGHPGAGWSWYETLVQRSALRELGAAGQELGAGWAGVWAAEALRIEAWRPRAGREADERSIPHELDLLRTAVHLEKGCYKGQETIARVHNLGHPPRRLVFLDLDGSEHTLPAAGSKVLAGTRTVGQVTSVGLHHEAGPIALAVIKRTVDPQAALLIRDESDPSAAVEYAAAQSVVVPPDAGQVRGRRSRGDFLRS